jgi:hypothetical protein
MKVKVWQGEEAKKNVMGFKSNGQNVRMELTPNYPNWIPILKIGVM